MKRKDNDLLTLSFPTLNLKERHSSDTIFNFLVRQIFNKENLADCVLFYIDI